MATTFAYGNNINTTLAAPISSGATSLTLTSSANLPTLSAGQIMSLTLNDAATQSVFEIVHVTAIVGAVCTIVRGQDGTTAQSWLAGDYAYAPVNREILNALSGGGSIVSGGGYVSLGNGLYLQWQKVTSFPFDGTATAVTFPIQFPNACFGVWPSVQDSSANGLLPKYDTPVATGANITVQGGTPGLTGTITYYTIGN